LSFAPRRWPEGSRCVSSLLFLINFKGEGEPSPRGSFSVFVRRERKGELSRVSSGEKENAPRPPSLFSFFCLPVTIVTYASPLGSPKMVDFSFLWIILFFFLPTSKVIKFMDPSSGSVAPGHGQRRESPLHSPALESMECGRLEVLLFSSPF